MNLVGIDVGASGSLCHIQNIDIPDNRELTFVDFSTHSLRGYIDYLKSVKDINLVIVEEVHSMPNQGVRAMFTFGQRFGEVQGMLQTLELPYILVKPTKWKKTLNIPAKSDKKKTAEIILNIFPTAELYTPRGRLLDGRSDSLCLAHYGELYLNKKG